MSTEIERTQFCGQCVEKQAEIEMLQAEIRDLERTSGKLMRESDHVNPWDDLPSYDR